MDKPVILLSFNSFGTAGGRRGCYEAHLKDRFGVWGAGTTAESAVESCARTAKSFKIDDLHTENPADYVVMVTNLKSFPSNKDFDLRLAELI